MDSVFDEAAAHSRFCELLGREEYAQAEQELLDACAELRQAGEIRGLTCVMGLLANLYSLPMYEDLAKAAEFFEEREMLSPEPYTFLQTTLFNFYVLRDFGKTIAKADEIKSRWDISHDRPSHYSATALRGEALLELGKTDATKEVLEEILGMIRSEPLGLPYGDEINLLSATVSRPDLAERSRDILKLIIPRIRSMEYVDRARLLLGET